MVEVHIIPYPNFQFLTMINCNFTYKSSVKFLKPSHTTVPLRARPLNNLQQMLVKYKTQLSGPNIDSGMVGSNCKLQKEFDTL
jgi:hypothetical protein